MRLYSAKVRLAGSLYNEVPKADLTAPEVHILRVLHGSDAVADLVETGKNKLRPDEERDRLLMLYGDGLVAQQLAKTPDLAFNQLFGVGAPLPDDIPGTPKAPVGKAAKADPETAPESSGGGAEE